LPVPPLWGSVRTLLPDSKIEGTKRGCL
jgi:hypothetical protein